MTKARDGVYSTDFSETSDANPSGNELLRIKTSLAICPLPGGQHMCPPCDAYFDSCSERISASAFSERGTIRHVYGLGWLIEVNVMF